MSEKLRVLCPDCDHENELDDLVCGSCGQPLTGRDAVPEHTRVGSPATASESGDSPARNEPTRRFDAHPSASLEALVDSQLVFPVWDGAVVGRGDDPDVDLWDALREQPLAVSRRHVRFVRRAGGWYVESMPGVENAPRVNGDPLGEGEQAGLRDGDNLVLGATAFVFRAGPT